MNRFAAAALIAVIAAATAAPQTAQPGPVITTLSPDRVVAGSPDTVITITGLNLTPQDEVLYQDYMFPATYVDSTHIRFTLPGSLVMFPSVGYLLVIDGIGGYSETLPLTVTIPFTTPPALPSGTVGAAYLQPIEINIQGTMSPYTWAVTGGSLPPGLSLNSGTGVLSGTPTAAGVFKFTLTVTDGSGFISDIGPGAGNWGDQAFTLIVNAPQTALQIWFPDTLPDGAVGKSYGENLYASGGNGTYSWSGSGVPPGLTVDSSGVVVGTPTQAGTFTMSVTVRDEAGASASKTYSLKIAGPALEIATTSPLPGATVGSPYSQQLTAKGGQAPLRWIANMFPPGLKLDGVTGAITGTPTASGTFGFTVQVTDGAGNIAKRDFVLVVSPQRLSITTASPLPAGTEGTAYSTSFTATAGSSPYTWSVSGATAGLTLDPASGVLSGAPATAGSYNFTVQVKDSTGSTASKAFDLTINRAPLAIVTGSLASGNAAASYSQQVQATGGVPPYTWSASGLPSGLAIDAATGAIGGTPAAAGSATVSIQVTDSTKTSAARQFTLTINARLLEVTTSALADGTAGTSYSQTLAAAGGTPPYSWVVTGSLPAGVGVNSGTGTLSGTPGAAGSFAIVANVTDSAGTSASKALTLTVRTPPLPQINLGGAGSANPAQQIKLTGALGSGYPLKLSGQLKLTFAPDAVSAADDPAIQFATGGRTFDFAVEPNSPQFPDAGLQTGTVAGTIVITLAHIEAGGVDMTPSPAPTQTIVVNRQAPTITSVAVVRTGTGFEVQIGGYSTPREVTQARFTFAAAAGSNVQTSDMTVPVGSTFTTWYIDPASRQFGSMFRYVQPFTVQGGVNGLASVTVTLSNSIGTSQPATANF